MLSSNKSSELMKAGHVAKLKVKIVLIKHEEKLLKDIKTKLITL